MISGKSSHRFKLFLTFLAGLTGAQAASAQQQQSPNYAPPPMFDEAPAPMVRPQTQNGYIVEPKVSAQPTINQPDPAQGYRPVIAPRVSVDPDSGRRAPSLPPATPIKPIAPTAPIPVPAPSTPTAPSLVVEQPRGVIAPAAPVPATIAPPVTAPALAKPAFMKPIVEKKDVYIKRQKPETAPAPAPVKKPVPPKSTAIETPIEEKPAAKTDDRTQPIKRGIAMPAARVTNKGSVTGPKTMPAIPTEGVDGQVLFESDDQTQEQTILERHQIQTEEKHKAETLVPIVPRPKENVTPATFESGEQNAMKRSIPFEPGQIRLPAEIADPIAAGVVQELDKNDRSDWRLQVRAFATPHGTGLSSDRRIALSRALSLRSTLITQGVAAERIDVLAEGVESTGGQSGDRIDLYLYGPKSE